MSRAITTFNGEPIGTAQDIINAEVEAWKQSIRHFRSRIGTKWIDKENYAMWRVRAEAEIKMIRAVTNTPSKSKA